MLTTPSLDLAVAWGAAYYAWLRHSGGRRIGGGIARSYYIAVETGDPSNAPAAGDSSLLCIVPQHLQEGQEIAAQARARTGAGPARGFPALHFHGGAGDKAGELIRVPPRQALAHASFAYHFARRQRSGAEHVPVTLAARSTEIGTLELWCVGKEAENRWRLEFNVRDIVVDEDGEADSTSTGSKAAVDVWPEDQVQAAARS